MDVEKLRELLQEKQELINKITAKKECLTDAENKRMQEIDAVIDKFEETVLKDKPPFEHPFLKPQVSHQNTLSNPNDMITKSVDKQITEENKAEPITPPAEIPENTKKNKGFKFTPEISIKQKRLGATGFSVNNGEIKFIIPKEVQEQRQKVKNKKKKAKKIANNSKKKNRK